jgi:hypothetical protein
MNHDDEIRLVVTKNQIQTMTQDEICNTLTQLEKRDLDYKNDPNMLNIAFKIYKIPMTAEGPEQPDIDRVREQRCNKINILSDIKSRARILDICNEPSNDYDDNEWNILDRINRLQEHYDDMYENIFRFDRSWERINKPYNVPVKLNYDGFQYRFCGIDDADEKKTPFQNLLLYLLRDLNHRRFRRYKDRCFKEIKTADGKSTRAWKAVMTIEEFILEVTQKELKYDQWKNLTSKASCLKDAVNYLTICTDIQFPEIKRNRSVWSFKNGIFIGRETKFLPYDSDEFLHLDPTILSCKYFDEDFENHEGDWYDIKTPIIQGIMDYQRFDEEVSRWIYVFCGRLCFEIGECDSWQVMPFFKGLAGTGKSTIVKLCGKFYEPEDYRVLSNNIEKKFGLDSIHDGFMFIGPEIKGDMGLDQAEFQSLVSGEDMSIARKFQKAKSLKWKIHGMIAGNENPGWKDNAGSILRRFVTWYFGKQVTPEMAMPNMEQQIIDTELGNFLQKSIRAYIDYTNKYSSSDIWKVLPPYFRNVRNQIAMVTSVFLNFLSSEKIVYGADKKVPQSIFTSVFNKHCEDNNLTKQKFTPDLYNGPFDSKDISIRVFTGSHNGRQYTNQPFIYGLEIANMETPLEINVDAY